MKKRVLSIFTALVMVLCIAPMAAFAEGASTEPTESSGELSLPKVSVEKKTGAAAVQALIDALPDAESIDESNMEEVMNQLESIDDAKLLLPDDEENSIDYTRYDAAVATLQTLMSGAGTGSESAPMVANNVVPTEVSTEAALQAAVSTGGSYVLTANIALTANLTVPSTSKVSLDLNGQSVTGAYAISISHDAALTILDGTISGDLENDGNMVITSGNINGNITNGPIGSFEMTEVTVSDKVFNLGIMQMTLCTIAGGVTSDLEFYMYSGEINGNVTNDGKFYMYSGEINGNVTNEGDFAMSDGWINGRVTNSDTFTMTGGTIDFYRVDGLHLENTGTFYAGGGTVTTPFPGVINNEGTIQAYGNGSTKFTDNHLLNEGTISGGNFDLNISIDHIDGIISGGTFDGCVSNCATISGGDFTGTATNDSKGTISGGTFKNKVINNGTITGGTYTGTVANSGLIYATANVTGSDSITYDNTAGNVITYKIGENKYAEQFVKTDSTATKPSIDPKQTGYTFVGWYTDPECTTAFGFENTTVTGDTTLYGKMIECDHKSNTNALSCTEDTICSVCSGTIKAAHILCWKADATHYWQECYRSGCDYTTVNNKKEIPTFEIEGKDKVHTDQDYSFSFELPEDSTVVRVEYAIPLMGSSDLKVNMTDGIYTGVVSKDNYAGAESFKIIVTVEINDGYTVEVTKKVMLTDEHEGGVATCNEKAICKVCLEPYGEKNPNNHANLKQFPAKTATAAEEGNKEYWYCDGCEKYYSDETAENEIKLKDIVIAKLAPLIIKGDGQTVTEGEKKALEFTSDAAFGDFIRVEIDGKTIDESNYTVKSGSTVVTLNADYVSALSAGEHALGIVSQSGTATAKITVNEKAEESGTKEDNTKESGSKESNTEKNTDVTSPKTGDNSNIFLWLALLFVSGGAVMATAFGRKKRRAE